MLLIINPKVLAHPLAIQIYQQFLLLSRFSPENQSQQSKLTQAQEIKINVKS